MLCVKKYLRISCSRYLQMEVEVGSRINRDFERFRCCLQVHLLWEVRASITVWLAAPEISRDEEEGN